MLYFFFQAEDGIRDLTVTGVQTWCSSDLEERLASHAQRIVEQDHRCAGGRRFLRGTAAAEEWTRESDHDQQDRKTAEQKQQHVLQCATADRALRHLTHEHESRELDLARARASHEMHEYRRR